MLESTGILAVDVMKNKKGDKIIISTTIFIALNLMFILGLFAFVYLAGTRAFVYEQTYAKKIALVIDNARPETVILMDVSDLAKVAEKNNKILEETISLDEEEKSVRVSLSDRRGYSYRYFSDYDVKFKLEGNKLSIIVKEKGGAERKTVGL